jgi:DNA-binding PadR family transcriptional regulator
MRTAGVPRGLLRFLVLRLLSEKPMSGVEIVEEVERETGGKWKPSSGSIYPLLAWLQDKGYTNESTTGEDGMKRHILTDEGKVFFEEQLKFGNKFLEKLECIAPMLIGGFHFGVNHENLLDARESAKRVLKTFIEFRALKNSITRQDVEQIVKILNDSNRKLKKIAQRIKEEQPS